MLLPKGILVSCLITCAVAFVPPMRGPRSTVSRRGEETECRGVGAMPKSGHHEDIMLKRK
jgi:hypothetical protein